MTPAQSAKLIEAAGGDKAFAELLGIHDDEGSAQRVNNWKRRGIPPAVLLEHQQKIQSIQSELKRA